MSCAPRSVCALVLAGRRKSGGSDPVAAAAGVPLKAFVAIHGQTMLDRVISTLRQCAEIDGIHVCLPDDVGLSSAGPHLAAGFATGDLLRVPSTDSPSAGVREFVSARMGRQTVLVTTADHPLLTAGMVREFLESFATSGAEAAVGLTDADRIAAAYPGSHRTSLKFTDGRFTGCNLFAFRGPGAMNVLGFWRRIEQHRKQPWRLAHAVGWLTLALYLGGRLSLRAAIARLGSRSGSRLHAVLIGDLHAGIDVDTVADLELASSIIAKREKGGTTKT